MKNSKKLFFVAYCFIVASCYSMTPSEAVSKCKTSIDNAKKNFEKFHNPIFRKIANTVIAEMEKIHDTLLHVCPVKEVSAKTSLCLKHEENLAWLNDIESNCKLNVDPNIDSNVQKNSESCEANKLPQRRKPVGKDIKVDQNFNPDDLKTQIETENQKSSINQDSEPKTKSTSLL